MNWMAFEYNDLRTKQIDEQNKSAALS